MTILPSPTPDPSSATTGIDRHALSDGALQQIINTAPNGIVLVVDGRIRLLNRSFLASTGLRANDWLGRPPADLLDPDSAAPDGLFDLRAGPAARPLVDRMLRFRTSHGAGWPVHTHAFLVQDEPDGPPIVVIRTGESTHSGSQWTESSEITRQIIGRTPAAMFVLSDRLVITHWNHAMEMITGIPAAAVVGVPGFWRNRFPGADRPLPELIIKGAVEQAMMGHRGHLIRRCAHVPGAFETEAFFPDFGPGGRWLAFTSAPVIDVRGRITGSITSMFDVTEQKATEAELLRLQSELEAEISQRTAQLAKARDALQLDLKQRLKTERELLARNAELTELTRKWTQSQEALLQAEKMASVGQLAAGVAHEINNPIGYVHSNLSSLETYVDDLLRLVDAFEAVEVLVPPDHAQAQGLARLKRDIDLDFVRADVPNLLKETREGITRVRKIVQDLKDFSRADSQQEWEYCDLRANLDSTLNIVANEIKYNADLVRDYQEISPVECLPSQLSQVFMNLLVNASHAIEGRPRGVITLGTRQHDGEVHVTIHDTGPGIPADIQSRIFDPFFTTKPVGKGTGLGLSLSYGIIQKHGGRLELDSRPGMGTTFRIILPLQQPTSTESSS